ncbi:16S rRNA (cytosine(1402)-N(4))-methyltransferase RsmH [Patescibacteria group bacterium]
MHKSVLLQETLFHLNIKRDGVYVDATFGGGETSLAILDKLSDKGKLIAIDLDKEAVHRADKLTKTYPQLIPIRANFKDIKSVLEDINILEVDGVVADLGISNYQLENKLRGFGLESDSLLDMRIDQDQIVIALDILKRYSEKDLIQLFQEVGEQPFSKRIARAIKEEKDFQSTAEFYKIIERAIPANLRYKAKKIAVNLFRALRMEVNSEIENLNEFIPKAINVLTESGRLVIISFHSIEDRIVKHALKNNKQVKILTKKPIIPSIGEVKNNPKSRSAKLRACKKIVIGD